MPRRGRSDLGEQRVFFVTTTTKNHKHYFDSREKLSQLLQIISSSVEKHKVTIYGFVLMVNHFHLLVGLSGGGPALSTFMRDIKSMTWRKLFPQESGIWMSRFDDVAIYTEDQFRIKLNYIHNNPVKAGLSQTPEGYDFSSAKVWNSGVEDGITCTDLSLDLK